MWINELKLYNFYQFKDVKLLFPEPDKNNRIIVFIGEHGAGATHIVDAIRWCLSQDEKLNNKIIRQGLNNFVRHKSKLPTIEMTVELIITDDDGRKYHVVRSALFQKNSAMSEYKNSANKYIIKYIDEFQDEEEIDNCTWYSKQVPEFLQFPEWHRLGLIDKYVQKEKSNLAGQEILRRTLDDLFLIRQEYIDIKAKEMEFWSEKEEIEKPNTLFSYVDNLYTVFEKLYNSKMEKFDNSLKRNLRDLENASGFTLSASLDTQVDILKSRRHILLLWLSVFKTIQENSNDFNFLLLDDFCRMLDFHELEKLMSICINEMDTQIFFFEKPWLLERLDAMGYEYVLYSIDTSKQKFFATVECVK